MSRFAAQFGREPLPLSSALVDAATKYSWPGNLRELENVVKRYLILEDEGQILRELRAHGGDGKAALPEPARPLSSPQNEPGDLKSLVRSLKGEAEMVAIRQALEATNWNRKAAARLLKISYKAILYKIRQHRLEKQKNIPS
jgi:DNA-binding NtrC family response regulator